MRKLPGGFPNQLWPISRPWRVRGVRVEVQMVLARNKEGISIKIKGLDHQPTQEEQGISCAWVRIDWFLDEKSMNSHASNSMLSMMAGKLKNKQSVVSSKPKGNFYVLSKFSSLKAIRDQFKYSIKFNLI